MLSQNQLQGADLAFTGGLLPFQGAGQLAERR